MVVIVIIVIIAIISLICTNFLFSRMVGPIPYVLPIENILGKLALVPVGDTRTIPFNMPRHLPQGTYADRKKGSGDGCKMWYVNSWAMGWSRDI